MEAMDLAYTNLIKNLLRGYSFVGRAEPVAFLVWFLENIFRLDDIEAADAICDGPGDRGIDAIYVDRDNSEVTFFQSKTRQTEGRDLGDQPIRDFYGSIAQFDTRAKIRAAIDADPKAELSKLFVRCEAAQRLSEGYKVRGVFVTNAIANDASKRAADPLEIDIFDRYTIADSYIEPSGIDRIDGIAHFDTSDSGLLEFSAGTDAKLYLITASADELLRLEGLSDGTLFSKNVRLSLGNTKVNRDVAKTIDDQSKHLFFPMYHNGITLIVER